MDGGTCTVDMFGTGTSISLGTLDAREYVTGNIKRIKSTGTGASTFIVDYVSDASNQ